ncbi:MAG: ATP-binding protein [Aristaeellaceae bacterium]
MNGLRKAQQVRATYVPGHIYLMTLCMLLGVGGLHAGLVIGLDRWNVGEMWTVHIVLAYWLLVSLGLTLLTRWQVTRYYEGPVKRIATAVSQVAQGDFSVYLPPAHTPDRLDYVDVLIQDFNKMVENLGSIETLKTEFFSNVSHEIKTPLAVILNTAELLQKEELPPEKRQEYVQTIIGASKRLNTLITDILKLNKLEKQAITPQAEPYDLCAQLCDCALQFESVWERKHIDFEADLEDSAIIAADESLLALVWTNLLSNAFKFTPEGGRVTLTQRSMEDNLVTVTVTDTGCGMDEETQKHIFDKFYQGDVSHAAEGNGLGLALVRRILAMTDASIQVRSRPGEGSSFTVTLPAPREGNEA